MASTGLATDSAVRSMMLSILSNAGMPTQSVVVTIQNLDTPGAIDLSYAKRGDRIQVSVSVPSGDVQWLNSPKPLGAAPTWAASSVWCYVKESS
ncbi:hypothetical protein [Singulisphaera acidiphila]|uniref:Uncharacterized protein n=1 Tax=Singulisphaera acidiphila (strain ATCC BAA-1392 / DSM 18658 / VKM B-2454 / MOB10) TaxID=886293 RepID=L0DNN6_SINAD|nr:hypothetical protein [Singulisphaera acidiphila]AGA30984.1 hypothetical protein Sinac_6928 [Singulisphaera acidiphila DSM 18658]